MVMRTSRTHLYVFSIGAIGIFCCLGVTAAEVRIEACWGEPWGVGRIEIERPAEQASIAAQDDRFSVSDQAGRVLYPVVGTQTINSVFANRSSRQVEDLLLVSRRRAA